MEPIIYESCHATWVFDRETMRFRRILKGIEIDGRPVATQWRPFFGVELDEDSDGFTVLLNSQRTKLIRSWRHTHDCTQCGGHVTEELSIEEVLSVVA